MLGVHLCSQCIAPLRAMDGHNLCEQQQPQLWFRLAPCIETAASMAQRPSTETQTGQENQRPDCTTMSPCSPSMEAERVFGDWHAHRFHPLLPGGVDNRCLPYCMGSCLEAPGNEGDFWVQPVLGAYKSDGVESFIVSSTTLPASPAGQACSSRLRQHVNSFPHKPPRAK